MANIKTYVKRPGARSHLLLDTTEAGIVLSNNLDPFSQYSVQSCIISVRGTGWTGELLVKKRGMESGHAPVTTIYQDASTDVTVAAGDPITADGEYYVRADAQDIVLDYSHTAGSVSVEFYYRLG